MTEKKTFEFSFSSGDFINRTENGEKFYEKLSVQNRRSGNATRKRLKII